jgi:hypothetical protein
LASSGKLATADELLATRELLKKNARGSSSNLRGNSSLPLAVLLSQSENPSQALQNTIAVQDLLKAKKFWRNDYLAIAAAQIALNTQPAQYSDTVKRAREFYDAMAQNHWFITGEDDYIFSCMLAISGLGVFGTNAKIEELMAALKPHFGGAGVRQSMAQVLVLGESCAETKRPVELIVNRIVALREALREQKLKPAADTAPILGVLSLLPVEPGMIASQVTSCYAKLKAEATFSKGMGKQNTLLFAASLVALSMAADLGPTVSAALANTITNLVIAEQMAVIIVIMAASSSAATS